MSVILHHHYLYVSRNEFKYNLFSKKLAYKMIIVLTYIMSSTSPQMKICTFEFWYC